MKSFSRQMPHWFSPYYFLKLFICSKTIKLQITELRLNVVRSLTCFDPSEQPLEDRHVAVHWNVNILEPLSWKEKRLQLLRGMCHGAIIKEWRRHLRIVDTGNYEAPFKAGCQPLFVLTGCLLLITPAFL